MINEDSMAGASFNQFTDFGPFLGCCTERGNDICLRFIDETAENVETTSVSGDRVSSNTWALAEYLLV